MWWEESGVGHILRMSMLLVYLRIYRMGYIVLFFKLTKYALDNDFFRPIYGEDAVK